MRKNHKKHIEKRLKRLRMIMYTTISLAIIETSGIFSLAKEGLLYVQSNALCNAFSPTTYVDIQINEPNGDTYYINSDGGHAISTSNEAHKIAEIVNSGISSTKKPILARARVVAMIYSENGILQGTTQAYTLTNSDFTTTASESNKWYQNGDYYYYTTALQPGETSSPLFTDVTFTDIENIPEDGYVELHVLVDTIEVDLAGTSESLEKNRDNITNNWKSLPSEPSDLWGTYLS